MTEEERKAKYREMEDLGRQLYILNKNDADSSGYNRGEKATEIRAKMAKLRMEIRGHRFL